MGGQDIEKGERIDDMEELNDLIEKWLVKDKGHSEYRGDYIEAMGKVFDYYASLPFEEDKNTE